MVIEKQNKNDQFHSSLRVHWLQTPPVSKHQIKTWPSEIFLWKDKVSFVLQRALPLEGSLWETFIMGHKGQTRGNRSKCPLWPHWKPENAILKTPKMAINQLAPGYLTELISHYIPQRSLRSSNKCLLVTPRTHTCYGNRAFSYAAPTLWNTLPIAIHTASSLDTFKLQLKNLFVS